jgi:hypothetical protein
MESARERWRIGEQREFEYILVIVQSGRAYTFEELSDLLDQVGKPFTVD